MVLSYNAPSLRNFIFVPMVSQIGPKWDKSWKFLDYHILARCTEIRSEKIPDVSRLWPIWPTCNHGYQIWPQSGSDWPQMGQIREIFRSDSVHFGAKSGNRAGEFRSLHVCLCVIDWRCVSPDMSCRQHSPHHYPLTLVVKKDMF